MDVEDVLDHAAREVLAGLLLQMRDREEKRKRREEKEKRREQPVRHNHHLAFEPSRRRLAQKSGQWRVQEINVKAQKKKGGVAKKIGKADRNA